MNRAFASQKKTQVHHLASGEAASLVRHPTQAGQSEENYLVLDNCHPRHVQNGQEHPRLSRPPCVEHVRVNSTNHLALPQDFETPVAAYEDKDSEFTVIHKFGGFLLVELLASWCGAGCTQAASYLQPLRIIAALMWLLGMEIMPHIGMTHTAGSCMPNTV